MERFENIIGFEWDTGNVDKNLFKHNVTNKECEEVFLNQPLCIESDEKHSLAENRYLCFGKSYEGRLLTIIFTIRKNLIRIVSARDQNKKERKFYNEKIKENSEI